MIATPAEAAVKAAIRSSIHLKFASGLSSGVALALTLGLSGVAHAQTGPAPGSDASKQAPVLEEVTVTGSRIKRTNDFTTPTPTTVIDTTTMENLGIVNVGEALQLTPANISNFTPANTGNSSFFTGAYIPDLRGLNPFFGTRTLTLINTRRAVQTTQGDSFDLNFIPQVLVSRIDTVTGGASAAYGSGAISGVINIILDNKLEGGKLNADIYQTDQSDGRDRHVSAAFGHGLFDDRVHFVIGGEYESQDGVGCETARTWCAQNKALYQTGTAGTNNTATYSLATNLHTNILNPNGVFYPTTTGATSTLQATADGTGVSAYNLGTTPYTSATNTSSVVGGDGNAANKFTNLLAPNKRGVITGMLTGKVTDDINFSADLNWGKVQSSTTVFGNNNQPTVFFIPGFSLVTPNITAQNAYLGGPNSSLYNAVVSQQYNSLNKDWFTQVPLYIDTTTTVKRFSGGLDGKIGDSSWTWEGYAEYGLTNREQLEPNELRAASYAMALDSVLVNGQPECRVTAAGGVAGVMDPANQFFNPGASYASATTAPSVLATNALLAQGCVPINPFGTQPLSQSAQAYSFGNLDERLRYEQTVAALNATGEIYKGVGAGPFSLAVGYEWRQEVGHNDEIESCLPGDSSAACAARSQDYQAQFGTPFGGIVTVNEAYLEASLPLLKDVPGARQLDLDIAARESRYDNKALYGLDVVNGVQPESTHNLTTWKVSLNYSPVESVRFRGTQSRDSRAANFRELYYGQVLQSGATGGYGYCSHLTSANPYGDPCTEGLLGNAALHPETSDTTTLGLVFTPSVLQGLQFSADWFHIRLKDAISAASVPEVELACANGNAASCSQIEFNNSYYDAAGNVVAAGTPGATTGAAAWQAGHDNANVINATAYNGAFYDTRGVDFSLNYVLALPDGSSLFTRLLTTWTGEQKYQGYAGGPVFNILGQTGAGTLLSDNNPAARWQGNLSITWLKGGLSLTPSMRFVGHGTLNYAGVTPSQTDLYNKVANNDPSIRGYGYTLLPFNYVPSYFLFNFNAAYSFDNLPSLKGLQVFAQVNNVFNKAPPFAATPVFFGNGYAGTNPIYFDTLGLATRIGFRLSF